MRFTRRSGLVRGGHVFRGFKKLSYRKANTGKNMANPTRVIISFLVSPRYRKTRLHQQMNESIPPTAMLSPPLLTSELPGVGGRIKAFPEDFEVEEIPAYEPSGTGEFLFLWIEKCDMGAEYFVRQIAQR